MTMQALTFATTRPMQAIITGKCSRVQERTVVGKCSRVQERTVVENNWTRRKLSL